MESSDGDQEGQGGWHVGSGRPGYNRPPKCVFQEKLLAKEDGGWGAEQGDQNAGVKGPRYKEDAWKVP